MRTLWGHLDKDAPVLSSAMPWRGYAAGLGLAAVQFLVLWIWPLQMAHAGLLFGLPAIVAAAALGGLWPGLVTTGAVAWVQWNLDLNIDHDTTGVLTHVAMTTLYGATISAGAEALLRQWARAAAVADRLRIREAHLQLILDTVPDAMVVCDERGIVQSFSIAAERLFGWQAHEILGQCVTRLMVEGGGETGLAQFIPTGLERRHVTMGLRRDGSAFPLEVTVATFETLGRQFYTVFVQDRSALDDAERKEADLRTELTLAWRQSSVGEMASLLAHEINQPLAAIANYLGAARRIAGRALSDPDRVNEAIDRASAQAMRASEIIRRLRRLVGRSTDGQKAEDINAVIREVDVFTRPVAREANVRVIYDFSDEPVIATADRIQIQQVVLNLVRNAVDAMMATQTRLLRIATRALDETIQVSVEDTGSGIDDAMIQQLFQPVRSTKPNGMGVGLSICRTIIEAHDGRIWMEKNPMGRATICFTLKKNTEGILDVDAA